MSKDELGDRMKLYENQEAGRRLIPLLPTFARIDGRSFHNFTKGMARPYDQRISDLMMHTTSSLIVETGAKLGYTQSDEITLYWHSNEFRSEIFFAGRIQKMVSQLGAIATLIFNKNLGAFQLYEYIHKLPTFDARVWQVPNLDEAANVFLWRELDATRNSVESSARSVFSHKQLEHKNQKHMHEMMFNQGINWNDYPDFFKRGSYFRRLVGGNDVLKLDLPKLSSIKNRVGVLFNNEQPIESI